MTRFLTRQFVVPRPAERPVTPAISAARRTALGQGLFFLVSGLWPVMHYRSFERLTGAKTDDWLVKTNGAFIAAAGAALVACSRSPGGDDVARTLGVATSAVLATADVVYVARRRISPVYLLDAAAETMWCLRWLAPRRRPPRRR
jgi:hypothetical protein